MRMMYGFQHHRAGCGHASRLSCRLSASQRLLPKCADGILSSRVEEWNGTRPAGDNGVALPTS